MTSGDISVSDRLQPAQDAFRAVLVHVQPEPSAQPRLTSAAALARMLDATLFGVAVETIDSAGVGDPFGLGDEQWWLELRKQLEENLARAEQAFRKSTEGLRTEWIALTDMPVATVSRLARGADIIVAGGSPRKGQRASRWCDPAELVLLSGRPVLIVPPSGGRLAAEAIVVAWKDTREARRALAEALPFLRGAREVMVLEVCDNSDFGNAQERTSSVVRGLKRHGVDARANAIVGGPEAVGVELNAAAAAMGADLIVAGGYGRSRLGEWVFGGATNDMLQKPERFILMSH